MENLLQNTSLVQRAYWLVKLRWLAIATLAVAVFSAKNVLGVELPTQTLYLISGLLILYNFFLYDLLKYCTWGGKEPTPRSVGRIITFQISADLFILATILHYSGGIENPFFLFFVFHMIIASILCSKLQSYMQATLAVLLFGLLVLLEFNTTIAHYSLEGFAASGHYLDKKYVLGTLGVLGVTLYLVVYMTTSICELLRRQQDSYEQANRLLEEKDDLKNKYVLRLTHDIKGHLAAIQSCVNIIDDEIVGPLNERQKDLVGRAYRRTGKCMAFITALLKLTKMKLTGQLEMDKFSLKNCIFDALAAVQARVRQKSITLDYEIDSSIDEIHGESVLIEETITNLLFNAVRYTPDGGQIRLEAKDGGAEIIVRIIDTGIGIPEGESIKIFEEFHRADNAREVERDGTGLGLSFAKQVVERHGGRIWAANNSEGKGSTFSFTLPKDLDNSEAE